MTGSQVNLVKLCVGVKEIGQLVEWQTTGLRTGRFSRPEHLTRLRPRRWKELLDGGSLYWVIKGHISVRQRIVDMEERVLVDGTRKCALIFSSELIMTVPYPHRPFQGWRYLDQDMCPPDLGSIDVVSVGSDPQPD